MTVKIIIILLILLFQPIVIFTPTLKSVHLAVCVALPKKKTFFSPNLPTECRGDSVLHAKEV